MDSGMIGKIDKAHRYATERDRFEMRSFTIAVRGDNSDHRVTYEDGQWSCECDYFRSRQCCAHTMSLELVLGDLVTAAQPDMQPMESMAGVA